MPMTLILACGNGVAKFEGKDIWYENKGEDDIALNVSGEGSVYYFVESQGIPIDDQVKGRDNHIKGRRTFYNKHKSVISDGQFEQNDLIVVKIKLKSLTEKRIENVAVTDILPAGFEIDTISTSEMRERK